MPLPPRAIPATEDRPRVGPSTSTPPPSRRQPATFVSWKLLSSGPARLPRRREHVEIVSDAPVRFLAGLDLHVDVFFRADGGADRPEIDLPQRTVAHHVHARAGLAVLHAEIEI